MASAYELQGNRCDTFLMPSDDKSHDVCKSQLNTFDDSFALASLLVIWEQGCCC